METGSLSRNSSLLCCLSGIILLFMIACHAKNGEKSNHTYSETTDDVEFYDLTEVDSEFSPKDIRKLKDILTNQMLPIISGKDKFELSEIIEYLNDIEKKIPVYLEDYNNSIEFYKTLMRAFHLTARLEPDDFDINLNVAAKYLEIAFVIGGLYQSEESKRFCEEYKKKGVQAAKDLAEKFPDNARSYGHLAHLLNVVEGDTKKALELYKRCIELDKEVEYCQDGYDMLTEELKPER